MRALVLSGGEGSRLRPITSTNAKQLIPVAGTPILFQALEAIAEAGIAEVGIVTGATGDEVRAAVGDGSRWGLDVTFIPQEAPLGIAHAVMTAEAFLADEPFLLYLGDNVLLGGVARFVEEFERSDADAHILLAQRARARALRRGGARGRPGRAPRREAQGASERPRARRRVPVPTARSSTRVTTLEPSWRGEYEITEAIQWLLDDGREVRAEMVSGYWKDTGPARGPARGEPHDAREPRGLDRGRASTTPPRSTGRSSCDRAPRSRAQRRSAVRSSSARARSSSVRPLGPDVSIGPGCRIEGSEVADSIVMEDCTIADVRGLTGSILGRRVEVRHSGGSGAHRLIVGDQSRVEVD